MKMWIYAKDHASLTSTEFSIRVLEVLRLDPEPDPIYMGFFACFILHRNVLKTGPRIRINFRIQIFTPVFSSSMDFVCPIILQEKNQPNLKFNDFSQFFGKPM
jgi:hypothetical protein